MVTPDAKRKAVAHAQEAYEVSERRACDILGADRSTVRYRTRRPDEAELREKIRAVATERSRFGYPLADRRSHANAERRRIHVMLACQGVHMNLKKL